ncbi:MAG: TauD/TfdA family dioxygenase [Alcaligenaceae bacterium]|nr:TauD/TfdA family dioxygenase [Alcaligenaceae bacterium]
MSMKIYPMREDFGAFIEDVDISKGVSPELHSQIEDALTKYAFLCFPHQVLEDEQQLAFSRMFGSLFFEPDVSRRRLKNGYFQDVSNIDNENKGLLKKDADRRMYSNANLLWHSDLSFVKNTARVTVLSARSLPADPPDTQYADMRAAWDALPDARKEMLINLEAEHSVFTSRAKVGFFNFTDEQRARFPAVTHPLVRVHKRSGRRSLYIGSHASHIVGLDEAVSKELLEELTEFCTQDRFVISHRWRPFDTVCWDDSCTLHRAMPFDSMNKRRELRWNAALEEPATV